MTTLVERKPDSVNPPPTTSPPTTAASPTVVGPPTASAPPKAATQVLPSDAVAAPKEQPSALTPMSGAKVAKPGRKMALLAVIGLIVGTGLGYLLGLPGKNSAVDDRNAALADKAAVVKDLEATKAELSGTESDLAQVRDDLMVARGELETTGGDLVAARSALTGVEEELTTVKSDLQGVQDELTGMTGQRDTCLAATTAGLDLVNQWENFFADLFTLFSLDWNSAAWAELESHMTEQDQKMFDQHEEFHKLVDSCKAG